MNKALINLIQNGVKIIDPSTTYIEDSVMIEAGVIIEPMVVLQGTTEIKSGTVIGSFSVIIDSQIGTNCTIISSRIVNSKLVGESNTGPFAFLRGETIIKKNAQVGAFSELNDTTLGENSKCKHFSYLGHANIGINVNIGAGTITCNYDGVKKYKTTVKDNVFVGANSLLIAPLTLFEESKTGAGAVVTKDVAEKDLVYGVPAVKHKT